MDLKICVVTLFVLFGVCSVNSLHPTSLQIRQRAQDALHQQLVASRTRLMPRSTINECHDYYYKLLKDTMELYEGKLQKCEETKNEQLQATANQGQADRDQTESTLDEVCRKVASCKENPKNIDFLDCAGALGEKSSRDVWSASRNSLDSASRIRQQLIVIDFNNDFCVNETNRAYLEATDKVNNDMIACFNGNQDVPNATPGTEAPQTPETEAPATPSPETEAPETEAPAPAPETEAPETPAPAPETEAPETEAPAPAPETEAPETEAPAPAPETEAPETEPPSEENDQVEELERSNTRAKLESFLKNWGKRF